MSQALSGIEELIHLDVLFLGVGMILSKDFRSLGPASAMYFEWNAIPDDFTAFAKIPSPLKSLTTFSTEETGPEI